MRVLRHRHVARAASILAIALPIAFGFTIAASPRPQPSKPGPDQREGITHARPAAMPGDAAPLPPFTVPAATEPPAGVSCDGSWFDDPVLHAGWCVPAGWGFTDGTGATPLARIPSSMLGSLRIRSARAFPWTPGAFPFDVVRDHGIVDVELILLEPDALATNECEPSTPRLVGGSTFLTCEQRYDRFGLPSTTGLLTATKVLVPLTRTPTTTHGEPAMTGARLLVVARTSAMTRSEEVDALWRLIGSIRAY